MNVAITVTDQWSGKQNRYKPGDHIGVLAVNDRSLVEGLMERLQTNGITLPPLEGLIQLQMKKDKQQGPFN